MDLRVVHWLCRLVVPCVFILVGCDPLYHTYAVTEPMQTTLPVEARGDDVWVMSLPTGAEVYVQPYDPEQLPSHTSIPQAYQGKTPLRLTLSPGNYWIEVTLGAEIFENFFSPPYEDVQFEPDGASSEALLFKPFSPAEKRRVLRYYRLEKQPQQGQTVIALFQPRGAPLERAMAFYPPGQHYRFVPEHLLEVLRAAHVPPDVQETFLGLMQRGGKAFWSRGEDYKVGLELRSDAVRGYIIAVYAGVPLPDPLLPDGGGF